MIRLRVPDDAAGTRLDRFVAELAEVGSRAAAERLIEAGKVTVGGATRPKSHRLAAGEELELEPEPPRTLEREEIPLTIAYEDEHLLVVDKPAGLVVHPAAGHATGTLVNALLGDAAGGEDEERPGIVHRLDRDTSGLLVVARSVEAHAALQDLIRRRQVEREYLALVRGKPRSRRGRIEAPIGRDRRDPARHSLDTETPREAITHFEVEELLPRHTLLRVRLETGRTHQIRVHLEAIGLAISGDRVYGAPHDVGLERQFLHAARLAFPHPVAGGHVEAESPLPDDLARALATARAGA